MLKTWYEGDFMRNFKKIVCVFLAVLMTLSGASVVSFAEENSVLGQTDVIDVISYDLYGARMSIEDLIFEAGDIAEIGAKLNGLKFDIVAVQEDFDISFEDFPTRPEIKDYHDLFVNQMKNYANVYKDNSIIDDVVDSVLDNSPTVIESHQTFSTSDGLNIYSLYPMYNTQRQLWKVSDNLFANGSGQVYDTGFVVTTIEVADGYFIDIYNVSADEYETSVAARQNQFKQLADFIKRHSVYDEDLGVYEHAVIVVGNLNAGICQEDTVYNNNGLIANLIAGAGLNDAWAVSTVATIVENPDNYDVYYNYAKNTELTTEQSYGHYDSVERILFADGNGISLDCESFNYADILGLNGESLSDHKAAISQIKYEIVEKSFEFGNENNDKEPEQELSWLLRFLYSIADAFKAIGVFFQNLFK